MTKQLFTLTLLLLAGFFAASETSAQSANLSFQGILKKANGLAADDGAYDLTFTLYDVETGGALVNEKHQETISGVEVAGGIYSVILGAQMSDPLMAAFDAPYFLGIRVGGPSATEMVPRIRLTSAPYALSLRGITNVFPSSGLVQADQIEVNGGVLAEGGTPGSNGANNNGYAFKDGGGDNDSGLFSTADGQVSLYANNTERLQANSTGVNVTGNATISSALVTSQLWVSSHVGTDLNFANQKGLQYNGWNDWRLVDRDDFTSGTDSWVCTDALTSSTSSSIENVSYGDFNGNVIRPMGASNTPVLKKQFNLSGVGAYTYVKVVFKYYFTDSWDYDEELGIAGFSIDLNAGNPVVCWQQTSAVYSNSSVSYTGDANFTDGATIAEMVAYNPGTSFYVFVGMRANSATSNERYALSNVEVWVR